MKKKLNEIFDEAKPQELDQFSDELKAPELSPEVLASVKGKVYTKTNLKKEKKTAKSVWLRFGTIAACFVLILSAVIVVPMLREDHGVEPYTSDKEPFSSTINPNVNDIILSADKVGSVFEVMKNGGTNQYTKIYAPDSKYLNLIPLPNAEYLPIYSSKKDTPSKESMQNFINEYVDAATTFFNINSKEYEIEKDERWNGDAFYKAEISEGKKGVRFTTSNNSIYFYNYSMGEKRLKINGSWISILESHTDEQIIEKLNDTITYVCASFGKDYTDIKICRNYSYQQLKTITIYLYSAQNTEFPSNFSKSPMTSDYICLTFYTDWGSGSYYSWDGSKEEAFLLEVSLYKALQNWNEYYTVDAKAKMLTLQEAEELLEKGYVFGGHSCPLCMAAQPEVDFSDYTCVDIEYVSDEEGKICIPFYAFYKFIGKSEYGVDTYAKTYVAAVQVSGYDEYFESQKDSHSNGSGVEKID